jgi:hypothetical protein
VCPPKLPNAEELAKGVPDAIAESGVNPDRVGDVLMPSDKIALPLPRRALRAESHFFQKKYSVLLQPLTLIFTSLKKKITPAWHFTLQSGKFRFQPKQQKQQFTTACP